MSTKPRAAIRWTLAAYDLVIMLLDAAFIMLLVTGTSQYQFSTVIINVAVFAVCTFASRFFFRIYTMFWRYGGIHVYVTLMVADCVGFLACFLLKHLLPIPQVSTLALVAFACMDLLLVMAMRMAYRYAFKYSSSHTALGRFLQSLLAFFGISRKDDGLPVQGRRINIAIIGAGETGMKLADRIRNNPESPYEIKFFIDNEKRKIGREFEDIKVYAEDNHIPSLIADNDVTQVVFAIPTLDQEKKRRLYELFTGLSCKVKNFEDNAGLEDSEGKVVLNEFSAEDLLFRKPVLVTDDSTRNYYKGKTVLITGGGGSIGSELCRQLAKMEVLRLVILDIYENCAYDIQQELRMKYKGRLDLQVEICSITDRAALDHVFAAYRPQIVINAAAHKHVPLMEHNVVEAIKNNVFGCRNVIDMCEKYGCERFMMVSTDKAVNPTNVMGATKRMCEMMVQSASTWGCVKYSATRFGNVLGSAGSVIPLFKRQIASGGPVTITDKRIIRYFMTIPEASQLVLASGAMARSGELFVLDMGQPVKILDLAQNMIRLSGAHNIEIVETGLRPGEKLYEELLVKTEELDKTSNSLIFIERDQPLTKEDIDARLSALEEACKSGDDDRAREVLRQAVPTFRRPEEVNSDVEKGGTAGDGEATDDVR